MIGGIVMVLTAIWVYQTMMKAKKSNVLMWVAACVVVFFAVEFVAQIFCIEIIDALGGKDIGDSYDRDLASVSDRRTQENPGGFFVNSLCELFPSVAGVLAVAAIRTLVILKEAPTPANLFSGIKEMLISIKDSFKTSSN
ncbi:hypothetical protein ACQE3E_01165 [Methylomonas sp. MED-D]|uniref:Uncharacterized protein n=1 Tax=Methylomonas koyamae TaxID=702114 RepID=A0A177NWJ6_9GAMM|nr:MULTISPECIES: hypothetical protein [Methylomonas]NJA05858.1 hypothetical protein [Methylococcaceae bacterium WWC4]MDT4330481.1 hypothetical protein [Methylomonas sp. MV1]OAI22388.1 hypothetical protein A1355_01875 [Methylomonas koyamae]OHX34880.1 hypothetical protein BJL95_12475 [Methylomonas sp. LWB]WGS86387.1 hypothetical protein QC632_01180 [Methylomonas sp. UP202]